MTKGLLSTLALAGIALGCGSSGNSNAVGNGAGSFLPLAVGNQWTYQVTDSDGTKTLKVQGVTAPAVVGGTGPNKEAMAFRLVTGSRFNDTNGDVSFQAVVGKRVVRFREESIGASSGNLKKEQYWDPSKLRVDDSAEHTALGAQWPENFIEYTVDKAKADGAAGGAGGTGVDDGGDRPLVTTSEPVMEMWSVVGVNESVTVPGGTFTTIKLKRTSLASASVRYFWFARGIGKVKEAGELGSGDQLEELSSYVVNP